MELPVPEKAPVMVLPDCNFFPHTLLPLHIFEPRYREMLGRVLEGHRMFCIGTLARPDRAGHPADSSAGVYLHGTIGLVRACLTRADGTSDLMLQGVARVLFAGWVQVDPYRVAVLHPLQTVVESWERVNAAAGRLATVADELLRRSHGVSPELEDALTSAEDPVALADLAAFHLLPDIHGRQALLAMESLEERLAFVTGRLLGLLKSL